MLVLLFALLAVAIPAAGQQSTPTPPAKSSPETPKSEDVVVLSGVATTARIADPNERVVFNGHVMRMADFVAAVSSSSGAVQRLHTPEKRNRETDQPTPPLKPSN